MAEWAELPEELLDRIAKQVITSSTMDLLRFRSVCSSWRSSVTYPPPHSFPNQITIRPNPNPTTGHLFDSGNFNLSKRTILHLSQTNHNRSNGWIIKIQQQDRDLGMHRLLNPLSESKIQPLPTNFPRILDITHTRVSELGQEYVLRCVEQGPFGFAGDIYREKVVVSSSSEDYEIMTIHVSGKLAMFRLSDSVWSIIDDMPNPYDDVVRYKGEFYAVDSTGRTVVVVGGGGSSLTVKEVASSVFGGDKKYLVELDGELLLVDRYLSNGSADDHSIIYYNNQIHPDYEIFVPNDDTYVMDTTVQFSVFKLDQCEKSWVEVKSLGDRLLFLGDNCSFSALAFDFAGIKGNCIYFTDRYFQSDREEDGSFKGHCIGLFNMEDGSIGPGSTQVFWPPPAWVTLPNT